MARSSSGEFSDKQQVRKGSMPQRSKKDLGEEVVEALEKDAEQIREDYRPLTEFEKARLKAVINTIPSCKPERQDARIINRLVDAAAILEDEDLDSSIVLILLGIAYERMRSETSKR